MGANRRPGQNRDETREDRAATFRLANFGRPRCALCVSDRLIN